ncbi:MAG: hypothetical protein ACLUYK_00580 [Eggerthella lenta]
MPSTDAWADCCGANGDEVPASPDFPAPPSESRRPAPVPHAARESGLRRHDRGPTNARLVIAVIV